MLCTELCGFLDSEGCYSRVDPVQVWYCVGPKDDPPRHSGFVDLFEHMMFKSTRRMLAGNLDRRVGQDSVTVNDVVQAALRAVPVWPMAGS
jgi:hypothetical protein